MENDASIAAPLQSVVAQPGMGQANLDHGPAMADRWPGLAGENAAGLALKRCFDVVVSLGLILVLLMPMLALAVAIRMDTPGPALFRQRRTGCGHVPFRMLKFRTMRTEAADASGLAQTARRDSRVTRVGRVLRRTSLDELPQLFNVLGGSMSLVGPRPHAIGTRVLGRPLAEAEPRYPMRYAARPGITGLAQIGGCRGELDSVDKLRRRVDLDLSYIETRSMALDLRILAGTLRGVFRDPGAY